LKRLVREVFREQRSVLPGVDVVVMARSAAVQADNRVLRASLERHFAVLVSAEERQHPKE
jgi:ribonuclease P protein component